MLQQNSGLVECCFCHSYQTKMYPSTSGIFENHKKLDEIKLKRLRHRYKAVLRKLLKFFSQFTKIFRSKTAKKCKTVVFQNFLTSLYFFGHVRWPSLGSCLRKFSSKTDSSPLKLGEKEKNFPEKKFFQTFSGHVPCKLEETAETIKSDVWKTLAQSAQKRDKKVFFKKTLCPPTKFWTGRMKFCQSYQKKLLKIWHLQSPQKTDKIYQKDFITRIMQF